MALKSDWKSPALVAVPFSTAKCGIMYKEGMRPVGDLLDLGVEYDILSKRGAYYRFNDEIVGQGREASKEYLRQNNQLAVEIDSLVRAKAGLTVRGDAGV